MNNITIISHSRIDPKFGKTSEVWTEIINGAKKCNQELTVLAPTKSYNDVKEWYSLVEKAIGSTDSLILPFTKGSDDFVEMLNSFEGDIVLVNTPPPEEWKKRLKKKIPYVGLDEYRMGYFAAETLLDSIGSQEKILVLLHEKNHEGHDLRINGIKASGVEVIKLYIDPEDENAIIPEEKRDLPVITLGIRGTEVALKTTKKIVAIDSNEKVLESLKQGNIVAVLTQNPEKQGREAVEKIILSRDKEDHLISPKILFK